MIILEDSSWPTTKKPFKILTILILSLENLKARFNRRLMSFSFDPTSSVLLPSLALLPISSNPLTAPSLHPSVTH